MMERKVFDQKTREMVHRATRIGLNIPITHDWIAHDFDVGLPVGFPAGDYYFTADLNPTCNGTSYPTVHDPIVPFRVVERLPSEP